MSDNPLNTQDNNIQLTRKMYALLGEQLKIIQEQLEVVEQLRSKKQLKPARDAQVIAEDMMENYQRLDDLADKIATEMERNNG